jgi:hypothetical protein
VSALPRRETMLSVNVAKTRSVGEVMVWKNRSGKEYVARLLGFVPAGTLRPDPDDEDDVYQEHRLRLDMGPGRGTCVVPPGPRPDDDPAGGDAHPQR